MMVGPYDVHAMNPVFIERPTVEGRMLFWLAALHGVEGMLYCKRGRAHPFEKDPSKGCMSL